MKTQKPLSYLLLLAALFSSGMAGNLLAATDTWNGASTTSSNWNDSANWGGSTPAATDTLVFDGTTRLSPTNNFSTTVTYAEIKFNSTAGAFVLGGSKNISLSGSAGVAIDDESSTNIETINIGGSNQFASGTTPKIVTVVGGGTLVLQSTWQGTIGFNKQGNGTFVLSGANSDTGTFLLSAGALNIQNTAGLGNASSHFAALNETSGAALQLQVSPVAAVATSLVGTGVSSNGALENVSGSNTYSGAITLAGATSIGADAGSSLTIAGGITNSGNLLTIVGAGGTTISTTPITGTGGLTQAGSGTLTMSGTNGYSGVTTVSSGSMIVTATGGSATGTGSLTVGAGATFGGTGTSSGTGFSISGTGTGTGSRANVLVGTISAGDTNTASVLTLTGSGASNIQNANLSFNLNATTAGGLGGTSNGGSAGGLGVANSGNALSVGSTAITFGSGVQSVTLTLNIQNEPAVIALNTPYVLIAGTTAIGGGGVHGSQYFGLSLGNTTTLSAGETETVITGNNLQVAFGTSLDGTWYANSYLVLYQNTNTGTDDIDVIVVPEPGTWAMMLGGLAVLIVWQRRKSKV